MKKLLLLIAALLPSLLAHSQGADDLGSKSAEVSFVARAEFSSTEDYYHLGNSSIYALLDGAFSPNFTYTVQTHLLSGYPRYLYENTLYSCATNWLDYAYMNYDFGALDLTVGKDNIKIGTFEFDQNDFDLYYEFTSTLWNILPAYQWGASLTYNPNDTFFLTAQVTTSPFGERPFASGKFAYSLFYGTTLRENFKELYSFNMIQYEDGSFLKLFNAGFNFTFGDWDLYLDGTIDFFSNNLPNSKHAYAQYNMSDKWQFGGRLGWDNMDYDYQWCTNRWYGGLLVNWCPSEPFRIHMIGGYDTLLEAAFLNLGVTWKISL